MEGKMGLRVCKPGDPTLMRTLESCIRLGHPLLVEEMGGTLEPQLLPLLEGTVSSQGHRRFIRLGGSDIDYDVNFKLYMTTKLANPHYLPEVCIATNLINFTVTQEVGTDSWSQTACRLPCERFTYHEMVIWDIHAVNKPEILNCPPRRNDNRRLQMSQLLASHKSIGCHGWEHDKSMTSIVNILFSAGGIQTVPEDKAKHHGQSVGKFSTAC